MGLSLLGERFEGVTLLARGHLLASPAYRSLGYLSRRDPSRAQSLRLERELAGPKLCYRPSADADRECTHVRRHEVP